MNLSLESDKDKNIFSKVVILGSTSYIARHFIKLLRSKPESTIHEFSRVSHPELFAQESRGRALESLFEDLDPSLVANFVGVVNDTPDECMEWNCHFPRDLLRAAESSNTVDKILLLGSASEYGLRADPKPIPETAPLLGTTPYALSKIAQFNLLQEPGFAELPILYARVFNIWGMGMAARTLPGRIEGELSSGTPSSGVIEVKDADSVRDFVFVERLASDLLDALAQPEGIGPINFGTGRGKSVRQFSEMFLDWASKGVSPKIAFSESESATYSVAELAKLESIIGGAETPGVL
jgi:nucleoside-diphosphate-sugar epimerase